MPTSPWSAARRRPLEAGIAAVASRRPAQRRLRTPWQTATEAAGRRDDVTYGIVEEYGGHGICTAMHMDPFLLTSRTRVRARGCVCGAWRLAVEPILTAGDPETRELDDGWTVVTADGSRAAHWEHSVAVTNDGPNNPHPPAD